MSSRALSGIRSAITAGLAAFVIFAVITADPPARDRAQEIGSLIRCPVCQGESIADSPSGLARDMMSLVRARINEGYSDDQIIGELLSSYSGSQLLDPPVTVSTIGLWLIPAGVLIVGAWVVIRARRARGSDLEVTRQ